MQFMYMKALDRALRLIKKMPFINSVKLVSFPDDLGCMIMRNCVIWQKNKLAIRHIS